MKNEAQNAIGDAIKVLHFMVQNNLPLDLFYFLLHCDEWDRFVAPPRHKFVTGATLLQL
jgi:hypothetical protein